MLNTCVRDLDSCKRELNEITCEELYEKNKLTVLSNGVLQQYRVKEVKMLRNVKCISAFVTNLIANG